MQSGDLFNKRFYASLIGPQVTDAAVASLVDACRAHAGYIAGVAVNLHQVHLAASLLAGADIAVIGAIAYPLGNLPTEIKTIHIQQCIKDGAHGVAAVMKIEALRAADYQSAREDVRAMVTACRGGLQSIGLIGNSASLGNAQALEAARIALDEGAVYVTNTGFGVDTKPEHVRTIREGLGNDLRIIAAGGCRTAEQAIEYLKAGADGIATSSAFEIIQQLDALEMLRVAR